MAKDSPAPKDTQVPVPFTESGSVSPDFMDELHGESMAEAGLLPYLRDEDKFAYHMSATPLWILGARFAPSQKFGGERAELSITTDLTRASKTAIWGGLADTPYWRNMVEKITGTLDMAEKNAASLGLEPPFNIGPVYAHRREYTNEYGTFDAWTFHAAPQTGGDGVADVANRPQSPGGGNDDTLPFDA